MFFKKIIDTFASIDDLRATFRVANGAFSGKNCIRTKH